MNNTTRRGFLGVLAGAAIAPKAVTSRKPKGQKHADRLDRLFGEHLRLVNSAYPVNLAWGISLPTRPNTDLRRYNVR